MTARLLQGSPLTLPPTTFLQQVIGSINEHADDVLLIDSGNDRSYTFREVYQMASAVSRRLSQIGIGPGDIVLSITHVCAEFYIMELGVWLCGAAISGINPAIPSEEIREFLRICSSRVVFVGEGYVETVEKASEGHSQTLTIISPNGKEPALDFHEIAAEPAEYVTHVDQPLGDDHCISVLYTSGTTGFPKGVICRDESVKFNIEAFKHMNEDLKALTTSPVYWISCLMSWSMALCWGRAIVFIDRASSVKALEVIAKHQVTMWFTSPSMLLEMTTLPEIEKYDTSSLRNVYVGGAPLFADQRRLICEKVLDGRNIIRSCYGSTEGGMITVDKGDIDPGSPQYGSIGQVANGATVKVIDLITEEIVPPHTLGEICVKSPAVLKAYSNKDIDESELNKDGFWHMGDLVYYDEEDYIYFQSRMKDVMKYRSYQIAPAELETVILKNNDVLECAVVGKPHPVDGEHPAAFVVLKSHSNLTEQELFDFVSSHVINEKKLRGGIFFVENLPKSVVGKILKRELRDKLAA